MIPIEHKQYFAGLDALKQARNNSLRGGRTNYEDLYSKLGNMYLSQEFADFLKEHGRDEYNFLNSSMNGLYAVQHPEKADPYEEWAAGRPFTVPNGMTLDSFLKKAEARKDYMKSNFRPAKPGWHKDGVAIF